jgi:two-component system sensor histidine kinase GlrK
VRSDVVEISHCGTHGQGGDMSVSRPRSFLQLVLLGFALVTLPLIIAIINAILSVDRLADQSEQAVLAAAEITKRSQDIVEHLIDMERKARQYDVLGDAALFVAYQTAHEQFVSMTSDLGRLPLDDKQQQDLQVLIEEELSVFQALGGASGPDDVGTEKSASQKDVETEQETANGNLDIETALDKFQSLTQFAVSIRKVSELVVNRQAENMQQAAKKSKQLLVWQALAVIPGTILFTTIFVALISRPIRQIRQAIRQLGEGDFSSQIVISGPRDLENLGRSLDWLRVRLLELEDAKRQFLGKVSHELKTPLAAIREGVSLMADGIVGAINPAQKEIIGILHQKSYHLQELLENLVNFSMAHARQATMVRQPVQLHEIVERVAVDHKPGMLAKMLKLDIHAAETVVIGDGAKLRTVIDNLVSNAVKYSPEGGTIHVTLESRDTHAILDVIDDGIGISKTEKHKIFDPFYQRGPTPDGHLKGNGLGLAIVHEYLTAHHGTIDVIDHPGNGAHFRVSLPVHERPIRMPS